MSPSSQLPTLQIPRSTGSLLSFLPRGASGGTPTVFIMYECPCIVLVECYCQASVVATAMASSWRGNKKLEGIADAGSKSTANVLESNAATIRCPSHKLAIRPLGYLL